ncbi:MAG: VWA domain-containing protein [Polyangiaceae bacterium]|jgi:Ca-activated chloride channel family protein|nr:VWA domain-containing protein [Polyangiaceae bacterium]
MKWMNVVLLSLTGMVLTGTGAYVVTPPGGYVASNDLDPEPDRPKREPNVPEGPFEGGHFSSGSTLRVEGRVGHERLTPGQSTFLLVELRGDESAPAARSPVDLSLVIDKSGSMRGTRLRHALDAAAGSVQRLSDGDSVSVLAFDERVQTVVAPTVIDNASRGRVLDALRSIAVGGNTCLSCGVELGLGLAGGAPGRVAKMVVLSDGEANRGVRDVPGFRTMAARARDRGVAITTVGVDVSYNEQVLSALAFESNGRHYFVENDAALPRVFEGEAQAATSTLASGAQTVVTLAPGVELERVFDRTFTRAGQRITVPLGAFTRGEAKTVLLQVRAPTGGSGGPVALADVDVTYHDQTTRAPGTCRGALAALAVRDKGDTSEGDPVVVGRVERSETSSSLAKAGELFASGRLSEANKLLEGQVSKLKAQKARASSAPPSGDAAAGVAARADADFNRQERVLEEAKRDFGAAQAAAEAAPPADRSPTTTSTPPRNAAAAAPPPPAPAPGRTREGQTAVKRNVDRSIDLAY